MKKILIAALSLALDSSVSHADWLTAAPRAEGARFAAMSLTNDQGMRAIISNVPASTNGIGLVPCQVQVSFFGADGSLIGNVTTVQLKAGESTSVPASRPPKLVRATVSIGDVSDDAKVCALRTRVEIFDLQTGTTFVSVPGESIGSNSECSVSAVPALGAARKNLSGRTNSAPVATLPSNSGAVVPAKPKSPVLAAGRPTVPR